jgi:5-formyltetrahydrofolate cyclo-ligase
VSRRSARAVEDRTVTKQQWRARLLAARRLRTDGERRAARAAVTEYLLRALPEWADAAGDAPVVCAFHPLPSEPLAADLPELLAGAGARVLVPVAHPHAPLDWCELGGTTVPGMLCVPEPSGPRLGPEAIRTADVMLLPALAVDAAGVRLGRGGGHYDRSLALLDPGGDEAARGRPSRAGRDGTVIRPRLIAVVFDDELVERLPRDRHDIPVTDVLTPGGGLRPVARDGPSGASSN